MSEQPKQLDQWEACPPGTLSKFSALEGTRRAKQQLTYAASALVTGCLLVGAVFWGMRGDEPPSGADLPYLGGLTCVEVLDQMDPFFADELKTDYRVRVDRHLVDCRPCRIAFQRRANELDVELSLVASQDASWSPIRVDVRRELRPRVASILPLLK